MAEPEDEAEDEEDAEAPPVSVDGEERMAKPGETLDWFDEDEDVYMNAEDAPAGARGGRLGCMRRADSP